MLDSILSDPRANARHRIDSAKALNDLADFTPQRPGVEQDRVIIHIDMGADTRLKGGVSDPADVLEIEASIRPRDADGKIIDAAPRPLIEASDRFDQEEVVPLKRGRGRPPGSRNKPKAIAEKDEPRVRGVPGFDV